MKKRIDVEVLYPGDWIRFVSSSDNKTRTYLGYILEITQEGELIVAIDTYRTKKVEDWNTWRISPKMVIKKYKHFMTFPIPARI